MILFDFRPLKAAVAALPDHTPACPEAEAEIKRINQIISETQWPLFLEEATKRVRELEERHRPRPQRVTPMLDLFS